MVTKEQLIEIIIAITERAGVKFAVGGGVAVFTYGYRRDTADVDAFFHYGDREKILRAANQILDSSFVLEELDPSHWTITHEDSPPDERVDLLFATGDPEESAVEMAVPRTYHKTPVMVFPVDLLVVSKFLAERDDAKDSLDIYSLLRRGAVTSEDVVLRLRQMGMGEDAERFKDFVTYLKELSTRKGSPVQKKKPCLSGSHTPQNQ